jgi:hypothetical protein
MYGIGIWEILIAALIVVVLLAIQGVFVPPGDNRRGRK